jgi:nicotinamide-nucleotide adenylyltransferase
MIGLYIGRFQPFHNGHLKIIKDALWKENQLIIVIGSAQYSNTFENPLTGAERERLINETLKSENLSRYHIIKIIDINNPPRWVAHVEKHCKFDSVYVGNDYNKVLFEKAGYKTIIHNRWEDLSATSIREKIVEGSPWIDLVPKKTYELLKEFDFENKIKKLRR